MSPDHPTARQSGLGGRDLERGQPYSGRSSDRCSFFSSTLAHSSASAIASFFSVMFGQVSCTFSAKGR